MNSIHWFSLRHRLLWLLLGGLCSILLVALLVSYQHAHHEVDELFDAQLAQSAHSLITLAAHDPGQVPAGSEPLAHKYQRHTKFQILDRSGTLILASDPTPITLKPASDGFSESRLDGIRWRHFALSDPAKNHRVIVSENHQIRETLTNSIVFRMMLPAFFGLPLIGFWVWLSTRHGLKSLNQIADEIALRAPDQLEAITPGKAPKEIRPLLVALNHLLARVKQTLESERRFTADAAHELRTPLAALQAQLQVAMRARNEAESKHSMIQLQEGLNRAKHLIEQLLQLARLDPESGIPTPSDVDLARVTESVCAELGDRILDKDLDFNLDLSSTALITGQEDWLRVLVRNLIENAIRYTPAGGRLHVGLCQESTSIIFSVCDSGPGIPASEREAVMHRFHRLMAHQPDLEPGSGLGLSIVARIAELHSADIHLSDAPPPLRTRSPSQISAEKHHRIGNTPVNIAVDSRQWLSPSAVLSYPRRVFHRVLSMKFSRLFLNRLQDPSRTADTVVVIDVLRSFTTAAVALSRGAKSIYPVEAISSAITLSETLPNTISVGAIGGGDPVPGFDFGNSPSRVMSANLTGKTIVMSTAAGVRGLQRFRQAKRLFAASLVCASATARAIREARAREVCFIITGEWVDRDGDEDIACADYIEALLKGQPADPAVFARRVQDSDFGKRFTAGTSPNLPLADLALATEVDKFDFAMPVHHDGEHLVIR